MSSRWMMVALAAAMVSGCSDEYAHQPMGSDSPQAAQVRAMLDALRAAPEAERPGVMASQSAGGLSEAQTAALQASLAELAKAQRAELKRLDAFGPSVYRATIELATDGQARVAAMLLVEQDGKLRWAGRN